MKKIFAMISAIMICFTVFAGFGAEQLFADELPVVASFNVNETSNGQYRASWIIKGSSQDVYVRVYASVNRNDQDGGYLLSEMQSGNLGSMNLYMNDVDSGYYCFRIELTTHTGEIVYAYSADSYFYDNESRDAFLNNVSAAWGDRSLYFRWTGADRAMIYLFDSDTKEMISSDEARGGISEIRIPNGRRKVIYGIASYNDGRAGRYIPAETALKDAPGAKGEFSEGNITDQPGYAFGVDTSEGYDISVYNNGVPAEYQVGEDGMLNLELKEGDNDILVFVGDGDHIRALEKKIELDTVPPAVTLAEDSLIEHTDKNHFTIRGNVEEGSVLTCNGDEIEVIKDCFSTGRTLAIGSNSFILSAVDRAGNRTDIDIEISRDMWTDTTKGLLAIGILAAAMTVTELILLYRKRSIQEQ